MNRIYRSVWNEISRTFVAAAETVRGRGKPSSGVCTEATPASRSGPTLARRRPMMLALEQRFMFDGAAAAPVADAAAAAAAAEAHAAIAAVPAAVEVRAADPVKDGGKKEVVFVDTSVADYKTLEAGIRDGVAIVEIDGTKDGLAQIAKWAESHSGYDSISILGHGSAATLNLGTTTLTSASLGSSVVQTELAEIGQSLTSDGDLMLYGCDVAKGADGEAFIADLAQATGADVAASTDTTGATSKGGDWTLEAATGTIDAESLALSDYPSVLSEISFLNSDAAFQGSGTTSIAKTVDGSNKTITFSATAGQTLMGGYDINGAFGFASYQSTGSGAYVKISAPTDYTFDLTSFAATISQGYLSITLTYSDGRPQASFTRSGSGTTLSSQSGFSLSIDDVSAVEISSSGDDVFNNFVISDVKAPPSFSGQYLHSFYDTEVANSFENVKASGVLKATESTATNRPIGAYGISGPGVTMGGTKDIGGTIYDVSRTGTYGTLYLVCTGTDKGKYVYVPNTTEIEKLSTETVGTTAHRVTRVDSFTVTATDSVGATATNVVSIDITGQNDTPEVTSGATASVAENNSGTVYTATASDRDSGQKLTYKLSGDDAGLFDIDGNGNVSFKTAPDFEKAGDKDSNNVYDITVTATDNAAIVNGFPDNNDSAPKAVQITVTDANDAPSGGNATVQATEDATYSLKTSDFGFTDPDGGSTPNTFTAIKLTELPTKGALWLDANHNGIHDDAALSVGSVIGTSEIAAGHLRFSPAADANGAAYANFSFKVSDGTANATDASKITIDVAAVNDAPTAVVLSGGNVSVFDRDYSIVGALTTIDVDGPTSYFTYTVVSVSLGVTSQAVGLFDVSGSTLHAALPASLQAGTYSIVVEVYDGDKAHQQTLSVTVSDTLTVTTADDTGDNATTGGSYAAELADGNGLSLREAVALAGTRTGGATIRFAAGVSKVTFDSLTIANDITIDTDAQPAMTIEGSFSISSGKTLTLSNGASDKLTLVYSITGDGTFVKAGSGTLTLSGNNNSCGAIRVDGGTLALGDQGQLGVSVGVSLAEGTTLAVSATKTLANAITLDGSATIDTGDATLTLGGIIYGHGGLIKAGNGTLIVGYNEFSGTTTTTVSGGTLSIESVSSLGSGAVSLADGTTLAVRSATKIYSAIALTGSATISADYALTLKGAISGTGSLTKTGAGALTLAGANKYSGTTTVSAGDLAISSDGNLGSGNVSLAAGTKLTVSNATALTLSGTISGTGGLTKDGSGTLMLTGTNTYKGGTIVNDGTLAITGDGKLGSGALTLANDAKLELSGTTTISNAIVLDGIATSIVTDAGAVATLSETVSGPILTKSGDGTLILSVVPKTINLTQIAGGALQIDTTLGGAVSAQAGTTVCGRGSVFSSLTIESGATLAPGAAGVGKLTLGGALTLNGTLAIEIASNTSYDAIVANGVSYGTGSTISVTCIGGYAPSSATSFLLIDNRSATSGAFTGLAQDALLKSGDNDFTVSYSASGTSGSTSLAFTSLPRPAVSGVTSSAGDGLHKIGDVITISVAFDRAVKVAGTPTLLLETGTTDRLARYESGSGTGTLVFTYTVQVGDTAADLDYASSGALLAGGSIVDAATDKPAVLTLAAPGAEHSLGHGKAIVIDGNAPTATIVLSDQSLTIGDTATVTITFSEAVSDFTVDDLAVANGSLSGLSTSDNITWSATFTPNAGISDTTNVITLANADVTDLAGNAGAGVTTSANYAVDTQRPSATIVVADSTLAAGETSRVTITFSEAVSGFTNDDLTVANGTLSAVSSSDGGATWTAMLTPTAGIKAASNLIRLNNSGVADLAGNAGSGMSDSNNYAVSTVRPTATIVVADSALKAGETSLVTITFSEAVTGFTNADLAVANGTLSPVTSSDGGITWSATLTPGDHVADSSNVITLNTAGVTDLAGSAGSGTTLSNYYAIDSVRPSATIVLADPSLTIGETTQVAITFSEAVSGFDASDLTVANGSLSGLTTSDNITWSATFTPNAEVSDTSNVITLNDHSVENGAGNANSGAATSANYAVLTARTLSYSATTLAEAAANDGSISSTATITLANESFAGADGSALGTVSNVPAGLTAQLIKVDATHARLSLTGNASAHANAQDISNLTVSFSDADFAGSPAAKVAGATTTLAIDFADPAAPPAAPPAPPPANAATLPPALAATIASGPTPVTTLAGTSQEVASAQASFLAPTSELGIGAATGTLAGALTTTTPGTGLGAAAGGGVGGMGGAAGPAGGTSGGAGGAVAATGERPGASPLAPSGQGEGGGFQVAAGRSISPSGDLVVNRGVADQSLASGALSQFSIPADAFAAGSGGAVVSLYVRQSDGRPLPGWLRFDPASGRFEGQPPPGFAGELSISVVARDAQGHEAVVRFKVKVGRAANGDGQRAQPERSGRAGLAEQLRLTGRPHPALDRLARLTGWRNAA